MSVNWIETTVGDFAPFSYGKALPERTRRAGAIPVISSAGVTGTHSVPLVESAGVVIGRKGTVGSVTFSPGAFWPIDTAFYVVDDPSRRDIRFTYYLLQTLQLERMNSDSAVPGLNRDNAHALRIKVPEGVNEQRRIADVLSSLDAKIDLNRRLNQTLEAMAQAIFKSWFVDFDPVKAKIAAKAEGRDPLRAAMSAISGKADAELDALPPEALEQLAATVALFPDEMEASELGEIPKGWAVASIREVVEGVYDGPHATPAESTNGPVFLGIRNLTGTALDLSEIRHIAEADWAQWTRRVTPRAGDIVFSYEATLGYFALLPNGLRCCLGRRLALIRPLAEQGFATFWFHQFIAPPFQRFLEKHTIPGATVDRIALKDFPSFPVLNAPLALQAGFATRVDPVWAAIHARQAESQRLAELRDTLLPKLLSGELSVAALNDEVAHAL